MKLTAMFIMVAALLFAACVTDEQEVAAIEAEMENTERGATEFCTVSIERVDGVKYYIIDCHWRITDDTIESFFAVHMQLCGVMARAIPREQAGDAVFACGTNSFWMDIPMSKLHDAYDAYNQDNGGRCLDIIDNSLEWYDYHPSRR